MSIQQTQSPALQPRAERARLRKDIIWLLALKTLALVVLFLILHRGPDRADPTPETVGAHLGADTQAQ